MKDADLILKNGSVYTVDKNKNKVEAVAIKDGKIIYVGSNEGIKDYESVKVIDLKGKMVLPGFIDGHCHPIMAAALSIGIQLNSDMSREDILNTVKDFIKENPNNKVFYGMGYPEWVFNENEPNKHMLDEICSDKPILLQSAGSHEAWCNTKALEVAGIDKDFKDPIPNFQYFVRDEQGNPTGHLIEFEPIQIILDAINPFDLKKVKDSFKKILAFFSSLGITSIAETGAIGEIATVGNTTISKMKQEGTLPLRVFGSYYITIKSNIEGAVEKLKALNNNYNDDEFAVRTLKIINDGTIESRSASFFEPYLDHAELASPLMQGDELYILCKEAAKEGLDIYIHAIGDKSIHETLMAAKHVRDAGYKDTRITNAHTYYVSPKDRELFGKYNVIVNTTSVWHFHCEESEGILGERSKELFMMKTLKNSGAVVGLGSDFPVDELGNDPIKGIEMAMTRQVFGEKDMPVLEPICERLTLDEAIECYTINNAYQLHMEDKIGSIEVGKYADIVVLEQNLYNTEVYEIHKVPVSMTISNGKIVYEK